MSDRDGTRAVVTGGASGIGNAAARRLAADGAQVAASTDEAPASRPRLGGVRGDVTDEARSHGRE